MSAGELVYRRRPSESKGEGALVLFHGRGVDELDLLPLLDELDPGRRLAGISVRAPLELTLGGFHWYEVRELGHPDPPTFLDTYALLSAWLDRLPEVTGVSLERTVLGGFSQGAVMAYAMSLGRGRPSPAALIALSGFIPEAPGFELDAEGHRGVAVAIGHGARDPVIPVEFGRAAAWRLGAAGLDVRYRESPGFHAIDPSFVAELARRLRRLFELPQAA